MSCRPEGRPGTKHAENLSTCTQLQAFGVLYKYPIGWLSCLPMMRALYSYTGSIAASEAVAAAAPQTKPVTLLPLALAGAAAAGAAVAVAKPMRLRPQSNCT